MSGKNQSGYVRTYELVKDRLKTCDLAEAAARLGFAPPVNGVLEAEFLGETYRISRDGVTGAGETVGENLTGPEDAKDDRFVEKSLLIYYLTSKGSGDPKEDYLFAGQFIRNFASSGGQRELSWQLRALEDQYNGQTDAFRKTMEKLGASPVQSKKEGLYIWEYPAFPKIRVQICYYEADEEDPCAIQIKFDSGASRYLEFESLAFLQGSVIKKLRRCAA